MRFLPTVAVLAALSFAPGSAFAECSCLCVDGALRTVCTGSEEVNASRSLCLAQASQQACPPAPALAEPEAYAAPMEGVENCRKAQIFDAGAGDHVAARICEVAQQH